MTRAINRRRRQKFHFYDRCKEFETAICNDGRMSDKTKGNLIGLLFVAVVAAIGTYVVIIGFGKLGRNPHDAPGWVILVAGAAFLSAAASMGISAIAYFTTGAKAGRDGSLGDDAPRPLRAAQIILSLGVVALLATVATWVAFNPGEPGNTARSLAFASGAVLIWTMFAGFSVWRLRKLFR